MGVKYGRKYSNIILDLMEAISQIDCLYSFLEMSSEDWNNLEEDEQRACIKTMSDDIFYGLGTEGSINIGRGVVTYDGNNHIIKVFDGEKRISIVNLV